jgi:hypothetical protein
MKIELEEEKVDEKKEPVEDDSEEESQETPDPDVEDSEEESTEDVSDEGLSEADYIAAAKEEYKLDGDFESVDDILAHLHEKATAASETQPPTDDVRNQVEEKLRELGYAKGYDGFMAESAATTTQPPQYQPQPQYGQPTGELPTNVSALNQAVANGEITQDAAEYMRPMMKIQDSLLSNVYGAIGQLFDMVGGLDKSTKSLGGSLREREWDAFATVNKGEWDKKAIDAFRDKHNYSNYESAVRGLVASDPQKFGAMMKNLEKTVTKKVIKKNRKIKALRKGSGASRMTAGPDWKTYQNTEFGINERKLEDDLKSKKITRKDFDAITDAIIADLRKRDQ